MRDSVGKITTMPILLTPLRPTAGQARVAGADVAAYPVAVRAMTGWVPQDRTVDPLLDEQPVADQLAASRRRRR